MKKNNHPFKEYLRYSTLGFELLVVILLFVGIGYGLDHWLETQKPWFLLACSLLGCALAMYFLIRAFTKKK